MNYLKDIQEYIDRYDTRTIEECQQYISSINSEAVRKQDTKNTLNKLTDKELETECAKFNGILLFTIAGERYLKREEVVTGWMNNDVEKDRVYSEAEAPKARCLTCNEILYETHKDLRWDYDSNTGRVLFMYDCKNKCLPRRAFYDNGEEWVPTPRLCKKCSNPTKHSIKKTKKKIVFIDTCPECGHIEKDEMELGGKEKKLKIDHEKEKAFRINQERFCSDEFGEKYNDWQIRSKRLAELVEKHKEREEKQEAYDKVAELRKLSIPAVKDHLGEVLEKTEYRNLAFKEADLSRIVSIDFTIEDPSNKNEYKSKNNLKKLIYKSLEDTNWRLMSEGISYRLGLLSGRIRVYENEDDLVKLLEK